jgi:hypothetical protein
MSIALRAERAAAEQLRRIGSEAIFSTAHPYYLDDWRSNLMDGVTPLDCEGDLQAGAGNELNNKGGAPAKFSAVRSSSALAVNTFAPFRRLPERLFLGGLERFRHAWFEKKCPNGLRTRCPPHLDFLAETHDAIVAVESKFLEPFGKAKRASFTTDSRPGCSCISIGKPRTPR